MHKNLHLAPPVNSGILCSQMGLTGTRGIRNESMRTRSATHMSGTLAELRDFNSG